MIRAILYGLSVYIVLMLIVSGISSLFSPKPEEPNLVIIGESEGEEVPTEQTETAECEAERTETETTESPFDFSVNVITESEEETAVAIAPIYRIEQTPLTEWVLEELEKRKSNEGVRVSGYSIHCCCIFSGICCSWRRYLLGGVPTTATKRHHRGRKRTGLYRFRYRLHQGWCG